MRNFILCLLMALVQPAWSETIQVKEHNQTRELQVKTGDRLDLDGGHNRYTIHAQGGEVDLHGSLNDVKVVGRVRFLEVHGVSNRVTVDADLEELDLHGTDNVVTLQGLRGRAMPNTRKHGVNNRIVSPEQR